MGTLPDAPARMGVQTVYSGDNGDAARDAVEWWNDELGITALAMTASSATAGIVVVTAPVAGYQDASADPRAGVIFLHRPGDAYKTWLILCHELGHAAFWLLDDPDHGYSIMAPDVAEFEPWAPRQRMYSVTDADRVAILAMVNP